MENTGNAMVAVKNLLNEVETARRGKNYVHMETAADGLLALLEGNQSLEAAQTRSQLAYERHMAAFQQAEEHLHAARLHGENAIKEAKVAGDLIGGLFAKMVLGGHTLPALRKGNDAIALLAEVESDAEKLLGATTGDDVPRLQRVLMNVRQHQILLAIEYGGDKSQVAVWKAELEANPVFQQYRTTGGADVLVKAQTYIG